MIKLAQVCFTYRHVYHDGKASSAFYALKKKINCSSFFFCPSIETCLGCPVSSTQSEMIVKVFCGALVCSSALSCHLGRAHQRQTDDLSVNVLLEEMVSHLFVHTARSRSLLLS